MPVFELPDPLDVIKNHNMRFPLRTLRKLAVIAKAERAAGKKSPLTKRVVSLNDVAWAFIQAGIEGYEAQHGVIEVSADGPVEEEEPTPEKASARPAAKKSAPPKVKK